MERIFARASVSISDLKKNPSRIINQSEGEPVAILNHNKASAYIIPAAAFEALMKRLEDYELSRCCARAGTRAVRQGFPR